MTSGWRGALAGALVVVLGAGCDQGSRRAASEPRERVEAPRTDAVGGAAPRPDGASAGEPPREEAETPLPLPPAREPAKVDPAARAAAQKENREGLKLHRRKQHAEARARFEKAAELDPTYSIALFNAACAASLGGDLPAARAHVGAYLEAEPGDEARVLHDPDLEALRGEPGFLELLRRRVRPPGARVGSLVVERRQDGGDLFVISEDGLDERPLAADPGAREYRASVTADGARVVYLWSPFDAAPVVPRQMGEGHPQRDWSDLRQQGRLYERRWDHELRSIPAAGGAATTLARRVHGYRLAEDGRTVLVVDEPSEGTYRVSAIPAAGGEARPLAEVPEASVWCPALLPDGTLVVASGTPHPWVSSLKIQVARYRGGAEEVLVQGKRGRGSDPEVPDFPVCALSADGAELHLGQVRALLGPSPRLEHLGGVDLGTGAYNFRNMGSRGEVLAGPPARLFLTVVGAQHQDEEGYEGSGRALWQTDPLGFTNDNGMGPPWWADTRIVELSWDGSERRELPVDEGVSQYGPSVTADGTRLALTELRPGADPWIVVTDRTGERRRRVAPGQYPIWIP